MRKGLKVYLQEGIIYLWKSLLDLNGIKQGDQHWNKTRFEIKIKQAPVRALLKQIHLRKFIRSIYFKFKDQLNLKAEEN